MRIQVFTNTISKIQYTLLSVPMPANEIVISTDCRLCHIWQFCFSFTICKDCFPLSHTVTASINPNVLFSLQATHNSCMIILFENKHTWELVHLSVSIQSKKCKFLYSAVSSPQDRSKRFTLYFPDRPVHSDTISASLGSIQPYATINARRLLVHISTTVYSQVLV